jgi:O-antigen/teichoic acid export membrane protein
MIATPAATTTRTESVFKPALLLMSGRTLAFAATFFIPVVLARVFDPAQFGTYKQLILIYSTVYLIAQAGMASSLYYFLPQAPGNAGSYVANSLGFLSGAGLVGLGTLLLLRPYIGQWLSNVQLYPYVSWIGLYVALMLVSSGLEIVLISRSRYTIASVSYAVSDLGRAAASILPVLMFRDLTRLLQGLVIVAALRAAITLYYFRREFRGSFRPNRFLLKTQLGYALPFGAAVLVEILQGSLPQYVVAYLSSPATFAIFAVGCLSIPLVDFAASPTSDVMMVKMQESLAAGHTRAVLEIWHDTTWKLALLFFPLTALVMVGAREIILLLFTSKYTASIPILMAWALTILFTTLQVDGVLRVFAQTRFILILNLMRLAIIAGLVRWSLTKFSLIGPVLVIVLATIAFKAAALVRMKPLLGVRVGELLPWRNLTALLGASAGAAAVAFAVKMTLKAPNFPLLLGMCAAYVVTYAVVVWNFDLLSAGERLAVSRQMRRIFLSVAGVLDYRKG